MVEKEKKKSSPKKKTEAKAVKKTKVSPKKSEPKKTAAKKSTNGFIPGLLKHYRDVVVKDMKNLNNYKNNLEVPRLEKISLNIGLGNAKDDKPGLERSLEDLATITGQKAVTTHARKAISNYKIRVGDPVGCRVTLRGLKMYEFFERLISIALPRVRDFNGLSVKSFDGKGNYNFGINEQIIFPEIDYDKIDKIKGLNISIITTAITDVECYQLLKALGFPFKRENAFDRKLEGVD